MAKLRERDLIINNLRSVCRKKGIIGITIPEDAELAKAMYAAVEHVDTDTYNRYKNSSSSEIGALSIDYLEVPVRASNCLKGADILVIGNLLDRTELELINIRGIGIRSYYEIIIQMFLLGYKYVDNKWVRFS